jgi:hypothetical protein
MYLIRLEDTDLPTLCSHPNPNWTVGQPTATKDILTVYNITSLEKI